ncbi:MAG TPA: CHASE domain-containing protein [Candidatus Saccharimonadales bacterium]
MAILVFAVGIGATVYYWRSLRQGVQADLKVAYARQQEMIGKAMMERLQVYQNFLRGTAGLVAINGTITQADWERYHQPYDIGKNYPDIEGVGVNRYLLPADVPAYMERRKNQGDTNFSIFPAGERSEYAPITFDARYTGNNGRSRGFDAWTDPVRKKAMEEAVKSNKMTITGRVNLVSESRKDRSSFILYMPVYRNGMPIQTYGERKSALLGFVFIAIDAETFIDSVMNAKQNPHIAIRVMDPSYDSKKPAYESDNFAKIAAESGSIMHTENSNISGHTWQTTFVGSPELLTNRERQLPNQALWRGLITCIFFAGLVWYLITDRERKYAEQKREEVQTAKDDLLSLASHQLRTPATVVKQYVGMLLQGYAGKLTDQQIDMLNNAYDSNERQLEIINQLLYVARLDADRIRLHPRKVDIAEMIRDAARDYTNQISERHQKLTFHLPKRTIFAEIDPHYLRMVIENLLSNASKYTPEKGAIDITLRRLPGELLISVKDNGVGIAPKAQKSIFEKFTRVENELSTDVNGSGVGLYLTKQIVELHGGSIDVSSSAGKGSVFTIYLPVHTRAQPKKGGSDSVENQPPAGLLR